MVIANISGEKIIYPGQKIMPIGWTQRLKGVSITFVKSASMTFLVSFIPILHFILVPLGFIVTLLSTLSAWKRSYRIEKFEIHCPSCDQKSLTTLSGSELPLRSFCAHCRNMIYVNN